MLCTSVALGINESSVWEHRGCSKACRPSQGIAEFAGLENDGVEQEQTYILHTKKNFNVYDM